MNKISTLLLFAILFAANNLFAQPTITNSIFPKVGTVINSIELDENAIDEGASGAEVTWDYSNIDLSGESHTTTIVDASSTPFASEFPDATIAQTDEGGYSYYSYTQNQWIRYGTGADGVLEKLTDTHIMLETPISYGTSYSDTFAGTTTSGGNSVTRSGTESYEADAYGTLITPAGTFTNVLRLKITQIVEDSFMGGKITTELTTYTWIKEGIEYGLMTMTYVKITTEAAGQLFTQESQNGEYTDHQGGGGDEKPSTPSNLYPNNPEMEVDLPITLEWDESTIPMIEKKDKDKIQEDITYEIEVSQDENFTGIINIAETLTTNSYTIDDIQEGTYHWRVRAINGEQASDWSESGGFTVASAQSELPAPMLISPADMATGLSTTSINFEWSAVENADQYNIQIDEDINFGSPENEFTSENTWNSGDLIIPENTTFYWRVHAWNDETQTQSEWSEVFSFTTAGASGNPPATPTNLMPEDEAINVLLSPTLEWEDADDADYWSIQISDDENFSNLIVDDNTNANGYSLNFDLEELTMYYWRVRAVNNDGESDWTETYSFTTEQTASVIESINDSKYSVYPNPAFSSIGIKNIELGTKYVILDIEGVEVMNGLYNGNINISRISSGTYFIIFNDKVTTKFIKE